MGGPTRPKKVESIRKDPMYKVGYQEGSLEVRTKALTFLQEKYLHPSVTRGSEQAKAILTLAEELATHLKAE